MSKPKTRNGRILRGIWGGHMSNEEMILALREIGVGIADDVIEEVNLLCSYGFYDSAATLVAHNAV